MMLWPTAIATYCRLSNTYVIGDAFHTWLVGNDQSDFPVAASAAMNEPLFSPKNSRPDAVDSSPAEAVDGAGPCTRSHATSPVWMLIARTDFVNVSPGAGRAVPPMKLLPASHSIFCGENRLHRSSAWK